ncbi:hypothetical protein LJC03_05700 [Methanobrevibacter sp. OttesenSCG-928-I08]|nr:hypothetical protein [Methanobrevibacter sp. OttesenSCG-928-I08]
MDILTSILFIALFIILMVFVFSMGILTPLIGKREIVLVLISGLIIGSLGGAFFLNPVYEELPNVVSTFETMSFNNEETLYFDVSSTKIDNLQKNLSSIEGVKSFEYTGITVNLWKLTEKDVNYINSSLGAIDPNYKSWNVSPSGNVDITIENGTDPLSALKSISDWIKLVYSESISYGQVHLKVVVQSSEVQKVKDLLLEDNIVPYKTEGPVSESKAKTEASMLNYNEFVILSGVFGIIVALFGVYFDNIVVYYRKFRRFVKERILKR